MQISWSKIFIGGSLLFHGTGVLAAHASSNTKNSLVRLENPEIYSGHGTISQPYTNTTFLNNSHPQICSPFSDKVVDKWDRPVKKAPIQQDLMNTLIQNLQKNKPVKYSVIHGIFNHPLDVKQVNDFFNRTYRHGFSPYNPLTISFDRNNPEQVNSILKSILYLSLHRHFLAHLQSVTETPLDEIVITDPAGKSATISRFIAENYCTDGITKLRILASLGYLDPNETLFKHKESDLLKADIDALPAVHLGRWILARAGKFSSPNDAALFIISAILSGDMMAPKIFIQHAQPYAILSILSPYFPDLFTQKKEEFFLHFVNQIFHSLPQNEATIIIDHAINVVESQKIKQQLRNALNDNIELTKNKSQHGDSSSKNESDQLLIMSFFATAIALGFGLYLLKPSANCDKTIEENAKKCKIQMTQALKALLESLHIPSLEPVVESSLINADGNNKNQITHVALQVKLTGSYAAKDAIYTQLSDDIRAHFKISESAITTTEKAGKITSLSMTIPAAQFHACPSELVFDASKYKKIETSPPQSLPHANEMENITKLRGEVDVISSRFNEQFTDLNNKLTRTLSKNPGQQDRVTSLHREMSRKIDSSKNTMEEIRKAIESEIKNLQNPTHQNAAASLLEHVEKLMVQFEEKRP